MNLFLETRNLVFNVEQDHLANISILEYRTCIKVFPVWLIVSNLIIIIYLIWKFILEFIYAPNLGAIVIEFIFIVNTISIYSIELIIKEELMRLQDTSIYNMGRSMVCFFTAFSRLKWDFVELCFFLIPFKFLVFFIRHIIQYQMAFHSPENLISILVKFDNLEDYIGNIQFL